VNGKARDSIASDIAQGRPALSHEADSLITRIQVLMTGPERTVFYEALDRRIAGSDSWAGWIEAPARYLSEFDPTLVADITTQLGQQLIELENRAKSRGGEV
jgi:hypothetical protein